MRRVELTHDVLCGVVKSSRDLRREREAREATERLLAEQHSRELSARRALVRARQIAIGCTALAIGAIVAAVFAYLSSQRARRAELEAQQTRAVSEQARSQAEQLLGYLTDDFVRELQSFGRLDVVAEFAKRQIDYFHALPPALKDTDTTRNGALALVQYGRAMRNLGKLDAASATAAEAVQLLEQLRRGSDASEATTIALALGTMIFPYALVLNHHVPAAASVFASFYILTCGRDEPRALSPWLEESVTRASKSAFGPRPAYMGEGGSIPFMAMLGEKFPRTQFVVTGVLGPHSNAHGPNEFLHLPTARRITCVIATVLADHATRG